MQFAICGDYQCLSRLTCKATQFFFRLTCKAEAGWRVKQWPFWYFSVFTCFPITMAISNTGSCKKRAVQIFPWRIRTQGLLVASLMEKLKHGHFLRHYEQYCLETWHNGTLWQDPSEHTTLSDLHPRSRSQGLMENLEKLKTWTFSQTLWTVQSWHLAQRYLVTRPFNPYQFEWPSPKVTVTRSDG